MGTVPNDSLDAYKISHTGLKKAVHHFDFLLNGEFFSNFEQALIQQCNLQVQVTLDKRNEPYIIDFGFSGTIDSDCDRCAATFPAKVQGEFSIYVKYTGDPLLQHEDESEVLFIGRDEQVIDISGYLYDFAHLCIPFYKICDDPGNTEYCDKEIVALLENMKPEEEKNPNADPRWEELNKLKDNLN
jgi:uncharacterized protein